MADKLPNPITLSELLSTPVEDVEWLVDRLIPVGSLTALSGMPGYFKTWVALHIAKSVSSGESLFGHFDTIKGNVLLVDEEDHKNFLQIRFNTLQVDPSSKIYLWIMEGFKADNASHMDQLKRFVQDHEIKLISFDSLVRIHSKEENDAVQMAQVFDNFLSLRKNGVSILFTHHHRKPGAHQSRDAGHSLRGSSDILASLDSHLMVDPNKEGTKLRITQNKMRVAEKLEPFEITIVKSDGRLEFEYDDVVDTEHKKDNAKADILEILEHGPLSTQQIKEELNGRVGVNSIGDALKELVVEQRLGVKVGQKNKKTYTLMEEPNSDI